MKFNGRRNPEKPKLLVIDDEPLYLELLTQYFTNKGYSVTALSSGEKILKLLFEDRYDVVILDVWMIDLNGVEIFKKIKKYSPSLPVILTSGYTSQELLQKLKNLGADGFIKKPFSLKEMQDLVDRLAGAAARLARPSRRTTLLVQDSDEDQLAMMNELLRDENLKVCTCRTRREMMELLDTMPAAQTVVIEYVPGDETLRLFVNGLKEANPELVLLVSLPEDESMHERAAAELPGVDGVLHKPFNVENVAILKEALERRTTPHEAGMNIRMAG